MNLHAFKYIYKPRNINVLKIEYQQDATIQMFIINYCLNMFQASLCPSSGEPRIAAFGVCAGSAVCGWLQLWGVAL